MSLLPALNSIRALWGFIGSVLIEKNWREGFELSGEFGFGGITFIVCSHCLVITDCPQYCERWRSSCVQMETEAASREWVERCHQPQACVRAQLLQSCPTLCDPVDRSPPDSSVHGLLQARILEWVAIASSRVCSQPRDWTCVCYIFCIGRQVLYHWCHCQPERELMVAEGRMRGGEAQTASRKDRDRLGLSVCGLVRQSVCLPTVSIYNKKLILVFSVSHKSLK